MLVLGLEQHQSPLWCAQATARTQEVSASRLSLKVDRNGVANGWWNQRCYRTMTRMWQTMNTMTRLIRRQHHAGVNLSYAGGRSFIQFDLFLR